MSCKHKQDRDVLSNLRMQPDIKHYVVSYKEQNRCLVLKLRGLNKQGFKIEKVFLVRSTLNPVIIFFYTEVPLREQHRYIFYISLFIHMT